MTKSPKAFAPDIFIHADHIEIIGEPAGLKSLGEMLILKAKLGKSASITFRDGANKPIKIISGDELPDG